MTHPVLKILPLVALLVAGIPSVAEAGRGGEHGPPGHVRPHHRDDTPDIRFQTDDFTLILNWRNDHDHTDWRSGPLPPGLERQLRTRGHLPPGLQMKTLPPVLIQRLGPPPRGYDRFVIGQDVVLVELASGTIADIIRNVF